MDPYALVWPYGEYADALVFTVLVSVLGRCGTGGAPAEEEVAVDVGAEDGIAGADVGWDITGWLVSWCSMKIGVYDSPPAPARSHGLGGETLAIAYDLSFSDDAVVGQVERVDRDVPPRLKSVV